MNVSVPPTSHDLCPVRCFSSGVACASVRVREAEGAYVWHRRGGVGSTPEAGVGGVGGTIVSRHTSHQCGIASHTCGTD